LTVLINDLENRTGEKVQILLTEPTVVRDASRDQTHGQLVKFVRGQCSHPDASVASAAIKIYDVLVSNDLRLASMAYAQESLHLNALLKDLKKPELATAVETVNIGGMLNTLEKNQLDFEAITQEKVEKKAQSTVQVLVSFVTPIRRKIFQILTLVDTLEEFEPEMYKTIVSEINVLVDEYVTRIRQRTTLSEKAAAPVTEPVAS
ncbi:MAG TPA: DUF6261 family protein, partial [Chitinispirillaceae bacterium]|nr:DUF6261 family protein [Chitinispirillaceae bacterium]